MKAQQRAALLLMAGVFLLSLSVLFSDSYYFIALLTLAIWLIITAAIYQRTYVTQETTPKLTQPQKEQLFSNFRTLLKD